MNLLIPFSVSEFIRDLYPARIGEVDISSNKDLSLLEERFFPITFSIVTEETR